MELDFSTRNCAQDSRNDDILETWTSTPTVAKRMRIDTILPCADAARGDDEVSRPPTPDSLVKLRAVIRAGECAPEATACRGGVGGMLADGGLGGYPKRHTFGNAGLLREFGGVKSWLELQRRQQEERGCSVLSLP